MIILICKSVFSQANLRITQPKTAALQFPQGIPYTLGNIGRVPYGQLVTAPLQLALPFDLCALDSKHTLDHERILLAVRGNCSFTTKLSNAQRVQAKLLIVTDNITQGSRNWVDDGKGGYLKTPIIFISHQDGLKLAQLSKKDHLTLSINFQEGKREVVRLDLLLTTADRHSYILVREIAPLLKSLQHSVELNVYFYSFTCPKCPHSDCFGKGEYCLVDLSNRNYQDGQLLLLEQVRASIILQQNQSVWLDYMNMYDGHCSQNYHPQCSQKVMKAIGINSTKIDQLVNQTFSQGIVYQSSNSLLESQRAFVKNSGSNQVPWLLVNGQVYKGYLNQFGVASMVCNGFKTMPNSCLKFMDKAVAEPGHIVLFVVLISATVILGFVLLAVMMKKCKSSELTQQIQNKISQAVGRLSSIRKQPEKPDLRQLIDKLDRYEPSQRL